MKKRIRNIIAALVALSCLPVTGMTAAADASEGVLHPWWGTAKWETLADLELLGEGTMIDPNVKLYLQETEERSDLVLAIPRYNTIRIVLREDIDVNAGTEMAVEIIAEYFPDFKQNGSTLCYEGNGVWLTQAEECDTGSCTLDLTVAKLPENASKIEAELLLRLANRHLISEFYGWGATVGYRICFFHGLKDYRRVKCYRGETIGQYIEVEQDWDAVQTYLDAHHPGYTVELVPDTESYNITGTEELTTREQITLACELWEQLDLAPVVILCENDDEAVLNVGVQNALENPGDVTLDTEIDIMDVIALNKQLLGAETLCDTAKKNADVGGDGTPDETDSLAILKYVVGLTETIGE